MEKITEKHFSFKCPMDFNAMQASANGVFCSKCSKEVFDLTDCSIDEVMALQRKHGRICGSIRIMPLAATAVALSAAACAPQEPQGNYGVTTGGTLKHSGMTLGKVCASFEPNKSEQP